MDGLRIEHLNAITARIAAALAAGAPADPTTLTFLVRHYLGADRPELQDTLGDALADALEQAPLDSSVLRRAAWLTLFAEATAIADDPRIVEAARTLIAQLRGQLPGTMRLDEACATVEACLRAAELVGPGDLVQTAVDHLEHIVSHSYQPGDGVDGGAAAQVCVASALLTAFEITGRLPYSMLAEELMQIARRQPWPDTDLVGHSDAARVLCRLAALHEDDSYRGAAVLATGADYRADAVRILTSHAARALAAPTPHAAAYGLALLALLK